ncbi:MAG: tryptophan synthase subunit alpha, partial [Clostridia bacterium]|nr:tryptophan synthase subunit alpha [Clostridia bacterium]
MNKLASAFSKDRTLAVRLTCGDPSLEVTADLLQAAAAGGADLALLALPFSDPTAEGPAAQAASLRALSAGVTTASALAFLEKLSPALPVVLTTYANVPFAYGIDRFFAACHAAGLCGLLVLDLPAEEREEFAGAARAHGIALAAQAAPAGEARLARVARAAEGVLLLDCGGREERRPALAAALRRHTDLPLLLPGGTQEEDP